MKYFLLSALIVTSLFAGELKECSSENPLKIEVARRMIGRWRVDRELTEKISPSAKNIPNIVALVEDASVKAEIESFLGDNPALEACYFSMVRMDSTTDSKVESLSAFIGEHDGSLFLFMATIGYVGGILWPAMSQLVIAEDSANDMLFLMPGQTLAFSRASKD